MKLELKLSGNLLKEENPLFRTKEVRKKKVVATSRYWHNGRYILVHLYTLNLYSCIFGIKYYRKNNVSNMWCIDFPLEYAYRSGFIKWIDFSRFYINTVFHILFFIS